VNWYVYIQTSLEIYLCLKLMVYWREFYWRFVWKWKT